MQAERQCAQRESTQGHIVKSWEKPERIKMTILPNNTCFGAFLARRGGQHLRIARSWVS